MSQVPLTLLNWKRSRLSLSRAGSCPGLRNRLILLYVQPSGERRGAVENQGEANLQPQSPAWHPVTAWLSPGHYGPLPQTQQVAAPGPSQLCHLRLPQAPSAPSMESGSWRDLVPGGPRLVSAVKLAPGHLWPYKAGGTSWGGSHLALEEQEAQKP